MSGDRDDILQIAEDEAGLPPHPQPIRRSQSDEAILEFLNDKMVGLDQNEREWNPDRNMSSGLAMEGTWDFSLKSCYQDMSCKTIMVQNRKSERATAFMEFFEGCQHEIMMTTCLCPKKCNFSICVRCRGVLCGNSCVKFVEEEASKKKDIVGAARGPEEETVQILRYPKGSAQLNDIDSLQSEHSGSVLNQLDRGVFPLGQFGPPNRELLLINDDPFLCFGVPMTVEYSWGESIFDLEVRNSIGRANFIRLSDTMREIDQFLPVEDVQKNMHCLAWYTDIENKDSGWCRGRISDLKDGGGVEVYFTDYGNKQTVQQWELLQMPDALMKLRPSSFRIMIGDFEKFDHKTYQEVEYYFKEFLKDKMFRVTIFQDQMTKSYSDADGDEPVKHLAKIDIINEEMKWLNLTDILVKDGLGRKVPLETTFNRHDYPAERLPTFHDDDIKSKIPVIFSYVKNPNDFYVIRRKVTGLREEMMAWLNSGSTKVEDYPLSMWKSSGYLCIARRKNRAWARAKIQEVTQWVSVKVRFIDFGDIANVEFQDLKALPKELMAIPQLAYRCSLPVIPRNENYKVKVTIGLKDFASWDDVKVVVLDLKSESAVHIVEVKLGDKELGLAERLLSMNICRGWDHLTN